MIKKIYNNLRERSYWSTKGSDLRRFIEAEIDKKSSTTNLNDTDKKKLRNYIDRFKNENKEKNDFKNENKEKNDFKSENKKKVISK